jgi:site-specific recombinase XerD
MQKQRILSRVPGSASDRFLSVSDLEYHAANWLLDSEVRQLSPNTTYSRKLVTDKLVWFLRQRELVRCGPAELRAFLAYLSTGHTQPEGRWGDGDQAAPAVRKKALRPASAKTFYARLQTFFNFLLDEGVIEQSPMATLKSPVARADQIIPFTREQQEALLAAARKSRHPKRDEAILLFLLDTGARASELCGLRVKDVDLTGRRCRVRGKGDKDRVLPFGGVTTKALWAYLREEPRDEKAPLFLSDRGENAGEHMTRSGLLQLFRRLGKVAKVEACRCSPHTCRHTFGIEFLRAGGSEFTLQMLLGHTDLAMTRRYVAIAQADVEAQHRSASPVDRLRGGGKRRRGC